MAEVREGVPVSSPPKYDCVESLGAADEQQQSQDEAQPGPGPERRHQPPVANLAFSSVQPRPSQVEAELRRVATSGRSRMSEYSVASEDLAPLPPAHAYSPHAMSRLAETSHSAAPLQQQPQLRNPRESQFSVASADMPTPPPPAQAYSAHTVSRLVNGASEPARATTATSVPTPAPRAAAPVAAPTAAPAATTGTGTASAKPLPAGLGPTPPVSRRHDTRQPAPGVKISAAERLQLFEKSNTYAAAMAEQQRMGQPRVQHQAPGFRPMRRSSGSASSLQSARRHSNTSDVDQPSYRRPDLSRFDSRARSSSFGSDQSRSSSNVDVPRGSGVSSPLLSQQHHQNALQVATQTRMMALATQGELVTMATQVQRLEAQLKQERDARTRLELEYRKALQESRLEEQSLRQDLNMLTSTVQNLVDTLRKGTLQPADNGNGAGPRGQVYDHPYGVDLEPWARAIEPGAEALSDEAEADVTGSEPLENSGGFNRKTVELTKQGGQLGFSIGGGDGVLPLFVQNITAGGPADRDGRLQVGDILLTIDGFDIERAFYHGVVALLRTTDDVVTFEVVRDPAALASLPGTMVPTSLQPQPVSIGTLPSSQPHLARPKPQSGMTSKVSNMSSSIPADPDQQQLVSVDLIKQSGSLGFSVAGVEDPDDPEGCGMFIDRITPGGAADINGQLRVGDQLMAVDGQTLTGKSREVAMGALRSTGRVVRLRVGRSNRSNRPAAVEPAPQHQPQAQHQRYSQAYSSPEKPPTPPRDTPSPRMFRDASSPARPTPAVVAEPLQPTGAGAPPHESPTKFAYGFGTPTSPEPQAPARDGANTADSATPAYLQDYVSAYPRLKVFAVTINKGNQSLGLGIRGKTSVSNLRGIYVESILPNGVAQSLHKIQARDRLLNVNGNDLSDVSKAEAVGLLREAGAVVSLVIGRDAGAAQDTITHM